MSRRWTVALAVACLCLALITGFAWFAAQNAATVAPSMTEKSQPSYAVWYRRTWTGLDPNQSYLLLVSGKGDLVNLRLTGDEKKQTYFSIPDDGAYHIVRGFKSYEALVYSDDPKQHYDVLRMTMQPCDGCLTQDEFRQTIVSSIPGFDQMGAMQKAQKLLAWSSSHADFAMDAQTLTTGTESQPVEATYFVNFMSNKLGVYCAGSAVFFRQVLDLFGIDALTVDFGETRDGLTHVTTIVNIEGKLYILDPTFAGFFAKAGKPIPVLDLIRAYRSHSMTGITFVEVDDTSRDYLYGGDRPSFCEFALPWVHACRAPADFSMFDWYMKDRKEALESHGFPVGISTIPALLDHHIYEIGPNSDAPIVKLFLRRLANMKVVNPL